LVKVVIHGSTRRQVSVPSLYQRTERNRCSSIPKECTSAGRALVRAARTAIARVSWRIAVGQDTPNSAATASTQRTSPANAVTIRSFNRAVSRAYGGTWLVCSVNVALAHSDSVHRHRFLTHHTVTSPSNGTSRTRWVVR
jgi:hypothetical protein